MWYIFGIPIVGFTAYIMQGIITNIITAGVHETGIVYQFLNYLWPGALILYLIFAGIWVVRKYNEEQYQQYRGF